MKWASQPRTALELCAFLCCRPEQQLQLNALAERVARLERQVKEGVRVAAPAGTSASAADDETPPFDPDDAPPPFEEAQPAPQAAPAAKNAPRKKAEPPRAAAVEGQEQWSAALAALGQENRGLQMPLTKAVYRGVQDDTLVLEFTKNDAMFLKILDNDAKKAAIAAAASKAFGRELSVVLRPQGAPAADSRAADPERTPTILQAREVFGRENVDILDE